MITYYYMISLYIYLKIFALIFYKYIMTIISWIILILQEHSNYCLAITDFLKYLSILNNTSLHMISIHALNSLVTWNTANFFHYQFHQISGKKLSTTTSLIYLSSISSMPFSYLSIDSQKWHITFFITRLSTSHSSRACFWIILFIYMNF